MFHTLLGITRFFVNILLCIKHDILTPLKSKYPIEHDIIVTSQKESIEPKIIDTKIFDDIDCKFFIFKSIDYVGAEINSIEAASIEGKFNKLIKLKLDP